MTDIKRTLHVLRAGFRDALGIDSTPPTIVLNTHEEGLRFLSAARQEVGSMPWEWVDPEPTESGQHLGVQIYGVRVQWPAVHKVLPSGRVVPR